MSRTSIIANCETLLRLAGEVVDEPSPDDVVVVCSHLITMAFNNLCRADDSNRQERYETFNHANEIIMNCACSLRNSNNRNHFDILSMLHNLVTLASVGLSPSEVSYYKNKKKSVKTYIAINQETGLLKIGKSVNPTSRMDGLKTGAATKPKLLLVIDDDVETNLHKRFSKLRVFGEWFKDDGSIFAFITDQNNKMKNQA